MSQIDKTVAELIIKRQFLDPPRLLIDAGDDVPFRGLCGYHRVRTGPARYMMMQVTTAA